MQSRHARFFKLLSALLGTLTERRFSARRIVALTFLVCAATTAPVLADSPPDQPPPVILPGEPRRQRISVAEQPGHDQDARAV